MRRWLRSAVIVSLALVAAAGPSRAVAPPEIAYQGRLLDATGAPLAGPVDLEIRVFDQPSAGAQLYRELHADVALADGVFSIRIGTGTDRLGSVDAELFEVASRWLEVAVDGETLSPRQAFSSVAYSFQSVIAEFAQQAVDALRVGGMDADELQSRIGTLETENGELRERLDVAECRLDAFERRRDVCEQPIDPGPCDAVIPRWAFDPVERACVQFTYGGCGGRENNFLTREECETKCVARPVCP
jgi:hypothetical protein